SNTAGGSTHEDRASHRSSRRRGGSRTPHRAGVGAAAIAVAGLLAGCQSLMPRPAETAAAPTLISPLASAVIGDPRRVVPPPLDTVPPRLPAPDVELDPVPEPRPDNLIEHLRASFSLPGSSDAALARELEYFAKHPDYVERVLTRARPYLYYIAEQLEARGMPTDLALLPIVESAFDPFAYSHGRAAGLWQIIPGTATRLGVTQSWWFDGRRDIVQSTR